jgi:hypothetical protein
VTYDDYARIKAEVERYSTFVETAHVDLKAENARLKAEVDRLTFDPMSYLDDHGEWMPRHTHLAAVARLKAEVERLTKAHSDALADFWNIHEGYFKLKAEVERLTKGVQS